MDGIGVAGGCAVADGEGCPAKWAAAMSLAELGVFDGVVFARLAGGHGGSASLSAISQILADLREMGVQKVAPCHCTGEQAIDAFATEYGKDFVEIGVGRKIVVQPSLS